MANRSRVPLSRRFKKPPKKMTDAQFWAKLRSLMENKIPLYYLENEAQAADSQQKKNKGGSVKRLKKNKGGTVKRKAISRKKVR